MKVMSDLNLRLEGYAREQLSQGKGTMSIVHELVRMAHIGIEDARTIVEHTRPSVMREGPRRGRRTFLYGLLILAIPLSIVGMLLYGEVISSGGTKVADALMMLVYPPMLLFEVVGLALAGYGWSEMRRSRNSIDPAAPRGPVSTGLWWRADPFEWK